MNFGERGGGGALFKVVCLCGCAVGVGNYKGETEEPGKKKKKREGQKKRKEKTTERGTKKTDNPFFFFPDPPSNLVQPPVNAPSTSERIETARVSGIAARHAARRKAIPP